MRSYDSYAVGPKLLSGWLSMTNYAFAIEYSTDRLAKTPYNRGDHLRLELVCL